MMPRKSRISSVRFGARFGLVDLMSAFDTFPLGQPAFISHTLDRAAHLRRSDEKLMALEGHRDARAYVVHRDSLVMKQDAERPASAAVDRRSAEIRRQSRHDLFRVARRGRGVRHGYRRHRGGETADPGRRRRHRIARHGDARRGAGRAALGDRDGKIDGELASAPRLLRQLRNPHRDEGRRLEARLPELQVRALSRAPTRS